MILRIIVCTGQVVILPTQMTKYISLSRNRQISTTEAFTGGKAPIQVFSSKFREISKNTYYAEHLWTAASEQKNVDYLQCNQFAFSCQSLLVPQQNAKWQKFIKFLKRKFLLKYVKQFLVLLVQLQTVKVELKERRLFSITRNQNHHWHKSYKRYTRVSLARFRKNWESLWEHL